MKLIQRSIVYLFSFLYMDFNRLKLVNDFISIDNCTIQYVTIDDIINQIKEHVSAKFFVS